MPAGKAVPAFDRTWLALVLTCQVFLGAFLGSAAQFALAVGVIFYVLPWMSLGLLDTARAVAEFDLPMRVLGLWWGNQLKTRPRNGPSLSLVPLGHPIFLGPVSRRAANGSEAPHGFWGSAPWQKPPLATLAARGFNGSFESLNLELLRRNAAERLVHLAPGRP
jgi:hypothetical protein